MGRRTIVEFAPAPEDERPLGVVNFASTLGDIPRQIHTFNEPESRPGRGGEQHGICSVEVQMPGHYRGANTYAQDQQYREHMRRKGYAEGED